MAVAHIMHLFLTHTNPYLGVRRMQPFVNPRLEQCDVFALIQAERAYQNARGPDGAGVQLEIGSWLLLMKGKLDAAIANWQATAAGDDVPALTELVSAIATGVACMEQHGGSVVAKAIADMEYTKTHHGYMSPNRRSQCYWPVLEAIRERIKASKEQASNATA